jgi:hypothetical protein
VNRHISVPVIPLKSFRNLEKLFWLRTLSYVPDDGTAALPFPFDGPPQIAIDPEGRFLAVLENCLISNRISSLN